MVVLGCLIRLHFVTFVFFVSLFLCFFVFCVFFVFFVSLFLCFFVSLLVFVRYPIFASFSKKNAPPHQAFHRCRQFMDRVMGGDSGGGGGGGGGTSGSGGTGNNKDSVVVRIDGSGGIQSNKEKESTPMVVPNGEDKV